MAKYIDAEKLKVLLSDLKKEHENCSGFHEGVEYFHEGVVFAVDEILDDMEKSIDSLQQEQPEVDLDKFAEKINAYKARYSYPESVSVNGAMAFMARMFYQYPNAARQWYENLPKATMDDNTRKEE